MITKKSDTSMETKPVHQLPYPYSLFIDLGEQHDEDTVFNEIEEELRKGDFQEAIQSLINIALDYSYSEYQDDRSNIPYYAVSFLTRLRSELTPYIHQLLPLLEVEDEEVWITAQDLFLGIGEAVIVPLFAELENDQADESLRIAAVEMLPILTEDLDDHRSSTISIFNQIVSDTLDLPNLVAFAIIGLIEMGAVETLPTILRAFDDNRVETEFISRKEVVRSLRNIHSDFLEEDELDDSVYNILPAKKNTGDIPNEPYVAELKVGRNDPCPCGSGLKYKKCCGA